MQTIDTPKAERRPIRVLPRELAEKIAAGEVVERPASAIKELVENSLDAGAGHIRVELEDGGRKRLTVIDDGSGIPADELELALERHATSKISQLDDLWNLHTMGFRGEALPSIAAISRFTLESRHRGAIDGRRLYLEGGRIKRDSGIEPTSPLGDQPHGTLISVEDLFFNVPARLKFLKSKSGESAQIRELLERVALCNPGVAFTLISEGRKALNLTAGTRAERVAQVLETDASNIESFDSIFEEITVRGWLDRDGRAPNSRYVYLSVNGRMVRDKLLQQAVLVALRSRMMEGEYPKIYLAVDVPPADVDVNVHPAKSEVRFRRARDVFQVVHGALERLAKAPSRAFYSTSLPEAEPEQPAKLFQEERVSYKVKSYDSFSETRTVSPPVVAEEHAAKQVAPAATVHVGGMTMAFEAPAVPSKTAAASTSPGFSRLHYIGQLKNTYLLFQDDQGLVVIDQHAAHERINYERIKGDFLANGLKPQPLLVSSVVKCKAEDVALAVDHAESFTKLGFEFEPFGNDCLLVRAAPEGMAPDRASELFRALLDELRASDEGEILVTDPTRLSAKVERILATSACHSSVRAGQSLSPNEARELAIQMDATESSLNCPHGRPASIRLTFGQIEGLFKR